MTEKQYRLNKWGTRLLKNNRPLFDWTNEADEIVDLLNEQQETITRKNKQINYLKRVIYNNEPKIFVQAVFDDLEKIE